MIDHDMTSRSETIAWLNDRCRQGFDRTKVETVLFAVTKLERAL